ncbi:uncharacterized protein LOC135199356 [Macrobrachium nipponense]|uniref:uncharacterized protein LOC135199356 n=1 Tax=Macrobrachium nipponense TaxID=159736 RepID=UPI0030C8385E
MMSYPYASLKEEDAHHYIQVKQEEEEEEVEEDETNSPMWDNERNYWNKHMCYWEGRESEDWARHVCRRRGVGTNEVDLRGFRAKDGISLQELTRQEFCYIVGEQYGAMFWKELRSYRAMQKQRCQRCVDSDAISTLMNISSKCSVQDIPSDLSYNGHLTSISRQSSPSPRFNQESAIPYPDRPMSGTYEVYSKYQDGRSSPGSLSPNYQEHNLYPEVYSQRSETKGALHQPPRLICLEQNNQKVSFHGDHPSPRPMKPIPGLISMDELESGTFPSHDSHRIHHLRALKGLDTDRDLYEKTPHPVTIYTPGHTVYSSPYLNSADGVVPNSHPSHHAQVQQDVSGRFHTRVIQHTHDSPHKYPPGQVYAQSQHYAGYRNFGRPSSNPSRNSSESDDEENEPGRLVIDIPDDTLEDHEMEAGGDPRSPHETNRTVPHLKKIPTKRKRDRGPKSWEFLMRLLACPKTNPSIIRWENEAEGSFRLVQPQEIANMWGTRSNKDDLSYNNFARALRYHYKTKLLFKISERQLVYGCGPAALAFYRELLKEQNMSLLDGNTG